MTNTTTTATDAATKTITLRVGRKAFDSLLHELHGNPMNDEGMWKLPVISVEPKAAVSTS